MNVHTKRKAKVCASGSILNTISDYIITNQEIRTITVPDLNGKVWILDKENTICAVLGYNADPALRGNYNVPQDQWKEGVFSGTHGSSWDKDGNLYVEDWNVAGRIMKLVKVK